MAASDPAQKANGKVPRTVAELLQDVETICRTDVQRLDVSGVDAAVVRSRASELLACCDRLAKTAPSNGKSARVKSTQHSWLRFLAYVTVVLSDASLLYLCRVQKVGFVDEGFAIYRNPDARGENVCHGSA